MCTNSNSLVKPSFMLFRKKVQHYNDPFQYSQNPPNYQNGSSYVLFNQSVVTHKYQGPAAPLAFSALPTKQTSKTATKVRWFAI